MGFTYDQCKILPLQILLPCGHFDAAAATKPTTGCDDNDDARQTILAGN